MSERSQRALLELPKLFPRLELTQTCHGLSSRGETASVECEGLSGLIIGAGKLSFEVLDPEREEEMQFNSSYKTLPTTTHGDVFFNYALQPDILSRSSCARQS
jgi:hypothetical protein